MFIDKDDLGLVKISLEITLMDYPNIHRYDQIMNLRNRILDYLTPQPVYGNHDHDNSKLKFLGDWSY